MFKNQFYKALSTKRDFYRLYDIPKEAETLVNSNLLKFKDGLLEYPCFYMGDIDPEQIIKDSKAEYIYEEDTGAYKIKYRDEYQHLPFERFYLCWKEIIQEHTTKQICMIEKTSDLLKGRVSVETTGLSPWTITNYMISLNNEIGREIFWHIPIMVIPMRLLDNNEDYLMTFSGVSGATSKEQLSEDNIHQHGWQLVNVVCTFLRLLHCKNVTVADKTTGKQYKDPKQAAKHRRPELEYKVLKIKVPDKGFEFNGRNITEFEYNERELYHINGTRRGHFKTYTAEKPLFGKHTGTWFWSPMFNTRAKRDYDLS